MRGAIPPLSHTCVIVVFHIVLEERIGCYLSQSTLSASASKYTRQPVGISKSVFVYRAGM
jgi:hypothetical protein